MDELKLRIEKLEKVVEDLILILGKINQRAVNLSIQTNYLEKQLNDANQNITI
ncbi:hypothetical protein MHI39_24820 [Heyndrickxia sp. FSL K6-6286]|uniref:hypothetical protein n=1 Tax=Heyndrickxia sp. FSL K6-6286 TaxID=2921510 RepID=UPI00315A9F91